MDSYHDERTELSVRLRGMADGIERILSLNSYGLITDEEAERLQRDQKRAEQLASKMESGTFEVAIVGTEKAGKSSFANALMENNVLPTKEPRCTYTTTSIRYDTSDHAVVEFFSRNEFEENFRSNLRLMGIPEADTLTVSGLRIEDYQNAFEALPEQTKDFYAGTVNADVLEILEHKNTLLHLLDSDRKTFSGEAMLQSQEFKKYIEDPEYAIAVKSIMLYSSALGQEMRNAVIYDVPGFDSPTEMHKKQTREKMQAADIILLVTRAHEPSLKGASVDMFRTVKDPDGLKLGEKLFVFANQVDRAESVDSNMKTLRRDLRKYRVMEDAHLMKRVLAGSAKARLQKIGALQGCECVDALARRGLVDGIEAMFELIRDYNVNNRFDVLKRRCGKLENEIQQMFDGIFRRQSQELPGIETGDREGAGIDLFEDSRDRIKEKLEDYRTELKKQYSGTQRPLTEKLLKRINNDIGAEQLGVTDEDFQQAINRVDINSQNTNSVDKDLRDKKRPELYEVFRREVVSLAQEERDASAQRIETIFLEGLGVTENNVNYDTLREAVRNYISEQTKNISGIGYYDSLVYRFSDALFDILLHIPMGHDDRFEYFQRNYREFYSLAMFDRDYMPDLPPQEQPLVSEILFHDFHHRDRIHERAKAEVALLNRVKSFLGDEVNGELLNNIRFLLTITGNQTVSDLIGCCERIVINNPECNRLTVLGRRVNDAVDDAKSTQEHDLLWYQKHFSNKPPKDYESVREEINQDIEALKVVLVNAVVPAISIESPFLSLERSIIRDLINSMERKSGAFRSFISRNIHMILPERYLQFNEVEQRRLTRARIRREVEAILDTIGHSIA